MNKVVNSVIWKFLERFGILGAQFVLQVVLANILGPELYGVLSLMIVFTTIANVFIQTGFSTSLIQNKNVDDDDYSSVFWATLGVAAICYALIFAGAPLIASFFNVPDIVWPLRVLALMLFPGALNSIQLAKASRELDFKKIFISNIGAILISGVTGIVIALRGGGIWALVLQSTLNVVIASLVMLFTVSWRPRFVFKLSRVKVLFSFGWKLLVSTLLDTVYQNLQTLVVGKKYDSGTLGYFNRGQQFPQAVISVVNGTVQSVMLPVMSAEQDNKSRVREIMRKSIKLSSYLLFPMMAGLIAVSDPLILLLFPSNEWAPAAPYLRVFCLSLALYPVHSCNLQAINAMGRSDIFLKLEIIKKIYGLVAVVIAVVFFDTPMAIAISGIVSAVISSFVNAFPNKKLIQYSYFEQIKDIFPNILLSAAMALPVYFIKFLELPTILILALQILSGMLIYVALSALFRHEMFGYLCATVKGIIKKRTQ